jgi:hypothetical protein
VVALAAIRAVVVAVTPQALVVVAVAGIVQHMAAVALDYLV